MSPLPSFPISPLDKARALTEQGRLEQAEALLRQHLQRKPNDADALDLAGIINASQRKYQRAAFYFEQARRLRPGDVHITLHLAETITLLDRESEAADMILPFVHANPTDSITAARAAKMLVHSGRLAECAEVLARCLKHHPDHAGLLHVQGMYYQRIGDSDAASRTLELLRRIDNPDHNLLLTLAMTLNYRSDAGPAVQYAAHAAFGRAMALRRPAEPAVHSARRRPGERVRVGLVSPDLRAHSVAFFVEPLLEHLDRARFSVTSYYLKPDGDEVTERIREKSDAFVAVVAATEAQLARRILDDGIDILIELSGLTAGHALGTMVMRPAPVQVTYIGYPNTTGLAEIDYRIVDSITDPPSSPRCTTETLARLDPCFLCYKPDPRFLQVPVAQPLSEGPFTFGCFNAAMKLSSSLLAAWATVLGATPGSRLLVKAMGMEDEPVRNHLRARMERAGIDTRRVNIVGRTPDPLDHLKRYHQVHLALDTFPYNGTTTTCEALLMGVPVLTLSGETHASRVGASLLRAAGLPSLVCANVDEYTSRAADLAADAPAIQQLREGLRERFLASQLCDGVAYGKRLSDLLSQLWETSGPRPSVGA